MAAIQDRGGAAAMTPETLAACRCALRARLEDAQAALALSVSADAAAVQLERLFERTVQFGDNQSGLLVGSAGSGARVIVTRAMRRLRDRHGTFKLVYLNGVVLQNELEAFKELTAQLAGSTDVKHKTVSYWNMYEYLRGLLAASREPVVVLLDALEQFATSAKQLLLYNLLDWLQAGDIRMGVLGITTDYNVVDNLEKRVRSRFSNLQIVIDRPTFAQVQQLLVNRLALHAVDWADEYPELVNVPSSASVEQFDAATRALLTDTSSFLTRLEFDFDIGKPAAFFLRLSAAAVSYLTTDEPVLSVKHFSRAKALLEPDHQLAVLATVNDHGIALLVGMGHLEKEGRRFVTLEMVYQRWEQFYRKHDLLHQMPTRSEAQRALENLLCLQLVEDAGDAFKLGRAKHAAAETLQPEYRAVYLNFAPRTLDGMIRNQSIKCSTAISEWSINGS